MEQRLEAVLAAQCLAAFCRQLEEHVQYSSATGGEANDSTQFEISLDLRLGDGTVVLDPEEQVRQTIARILERFAVLRNARAVQREFNEQRLHMPRLIQAGADLGKLVWVKPTYQMIQQVLTSPVYAGMFVYGRRKQEMTPGDPPIMAERRRPVEEWDITVPDVYPAYLSYDQYLRNRQQLRDNMDNFAKKGRGAPRQGLALLQGLVLCGACGRRMTVSHGREYRRYECRRAQLDYAAPPCQAFPVRHLDEAVGAVFLEAVKPAALETALAAFSVMERERREIDRHWQLRIERARYEADRAQRQYDAVEPENRSVARSLEARWNAALEALEALKGEYAVLQQTDLLPLGEADQDTVRRLATNLPALWRAATTTMVDRKRLLRLVVTEVALTTYPVEHRAEFKILWCGGAVTLHTADCPPTGIHQRTKPDVLKRIAVLAGDHPDHQVAARLNAEGHRTRTGKEWTYARVGSMRKQHAIPTSCPLDPGETAARADGLVSARQAAERLGVSPSLVNLWVKHGVLVADQRVPASKLWVRLNNDDLARLTGGVAKAISLPTFGSLRAKAGLSPPDLWQQVVDGRYLAFRVPYGLTWQWHLKEIHPTNPSKQTSTIRRNRKGNAPYE